MVLFHSSLWLGNIPLYVYRKTQLFLKIKNHQNYGPRPKFQLMFYFLQFSFYLPTNNFIIMLHFKIPNLPVNHFKTLSWSTFSINILIMKYSSVQFSGSVVSDSLRPHESQHTRPPCPSPTSRVYSNSCPSSRWCHPAILSSVVPFSSCPQSFPASGLFQQVNSSCEVAKVLEFQLQHQSFQWTSRTDLL